MKKTSFWIRFVVLISIFSVQCTPVPHRNGASQGFANSSAPRKVAVADVTQPEDWVAALPGNSDEYLKLVQSKIATMAKRNKVNSENPKIIASRLAKYMSFLMYGYDFKPGATPAKKEKMATTLLSRLLSSSTQFIMCPDLSDYTCLEKVPAIEPSVAMRVEDPKLKLGDVQNLNADLNESLEFYFNTQIFTPERNVDLSKTLAETLAQKIKDDGKDGVYMALYGIDDIEKSMKVVYQALMDKIQSGVDVKAVFDQNGVTKGAPAPMLFTYVEPKDAATHARWMLNPIVSGKDNGKTNMAFQYNVGTQGLIQALSKGAKVDEDTKGRIEWPNNGIMHNKFFVFKNGDEMSVWTGTANVARTCMGTERNSNMGVYIRNTEVARAFLDEFNEMYTFQTPSPAKADDKFVGLKGDGYPMGRFHGSKTPNTHRLFHFSKDKSDLKVYFSPTDDGEHRAILPMLHSARKGDILRISMFGGAGVEYVRAMQLAASRGATIQVIIDSPTGFGVGSWAAVPGKGDSTLREINPFDRDAKIVMKKNNRGEDQMWKQNHQKIGLLLRNIGGHYRAEQLIVGSQNWSSSGNDKNDENLIALRNENEGLRAGSAFDEHFSTFLWPRAVDLDAKETVKADPEDEEAE